MLASLIDTKVAIAHNKAKVIDCRTVTTGGFTFMVTSILRAWAVFSAARIDPEVKLKA
jgi:hypothetical protein